MANSKTENQRAAATSEPVMQPAPVASAPVPAPSKGVSTSTLLVLLILSSILSSTLSPLVQTGLRRAAEAYLGLPAGHSNNIIAQKQQSNYGYYSQPIITSPSAQQQQQKQQQQQQQQQGGQYVPLAKRATKLDEGTYKCKHSYSMYIAHRDPTIIIIDDFLQPGEAEHMIAVATPKMERSRVFGDKVHSEARTSSSAYLPKSADNVIRCIEERASFFSNISVADSEPLQVVWYTEGQEFKPHHDYISEKDLKHDYWTRFGQRYVTILVYLNEPDEGGSTVFPKLNLDFKPKKNSAVFWYNVGLNEEEDERTLHGGAPVKGGEKYAINIWQRKMIPRVTKVLSEKAAQEAQKAADPEKRVDYTKNDNQGSQEQKAETESKPKEDL
jgi:prolyl 4-hydroxylase